MKHILSVILRIFLFLLLAAVLELNHNTIIGWILFLGLSGLWIFLTERYHHGFLLFLVYSSSTVAGGLDEIS